MAHELSDDGLILPEAILESVEKNNEELSNVFLLINRYLLCMIIDNGLKHSEWALVLKIR